MSGRAFLDTNVLVYLFDSGEPIKQAAARRVLNEVREESLVLSTQVLSEFYVVVTRKLADPLDPATAARAVDQLARFHVTVIGSDTVRSAIITSQRHRLSFWDALIVESAASSACDRLLTEDLAAGTVIRGVRIDNPFAADADA